MPPAIVASRPARARAVRSATVSSAQRADGFAWLFSEPFNPKLGLWTSPAPGHTKPVAALAAVHSGVTAACRLVIAAQFGALGALPVTDILAALRRLQWLDGSQRHGCFRWYHEEPEPVDTNAAFFAGLNLAALAVNYRAELGPAASAILDEILRDLFCWFDRETDTAAAFYPNKFLGDLVCAWLLHEQLADAPSPDRLLGAMERAADYWREQHWGWGEHLSDTYSTVMLNELSALLLFSRKLPSRLHGKYHALFVELLAIEDAFAEGPRVPAIRTYAFLQRDRHTHYRDLVRAWTPEDLGLTPVAHIAFGHLFNELGWHRLAPPRARPSALQDIPCHGGARARAWLTPSARLGTLSRYPIMAGTDHATWGLSWQTMPVAFTAGAGGWGFLRWHTRENGIDRFHPARDKRAAYLNNALTDQTAPPVVGLTDSLQAGPDAVVVRRMPALSRAWETLADQLVLLGEEFTVVREEQSPKCSRLLVEAAGTPVTFLFFPLDSGGRPMLQREGGDREKTWEVIWPAETLRGCERTTAVWMICWGRDVPLPAGPWPLADPAPVLRGAGEHAWSLRWSRAAGEVTVRVDPLAESALTLSEDEA